MARPKLYASAADRVRACREKKNLVAVSFDLPRDVVDGLNEFLKFKDAKKSDVIARLIRTQLLRRR